MLVHKDVDGYVIGKRIILSSNFAESSKYMIQNYQDAITIYRWHRHLDLFITFTYNAQWLEIWTALDLFPDQKAKDRSDIISRIFKIKLEELISDIIKKHHFGKMVTGNMLIFHLNFYEDDYR